MADNWNGAATNFRCPFTGRPIKVCPVGSNWVAVSEGQSGGWVTSMFGDRAALLRFLDRVVPTLETKEPANQPIPTCPMLGVPFIKKDVPGAGWVATVSDGRGNGYRTSPFWSERHLDYFLSTRAGVPPLFTADIKVRDRERPRPAVPTDASEAQSRREAADEVTDRVVEEARHDGGARVVVPVNGTRRKG